MGIDIVKVTSRGQIVIPKSIRDDLGIKKGEKFLAYDTDSTIILKMLKGLEKGLIEGELEEVFATTWRTAKERKITNRDVDEEIRMYRVEKRKK